MSFITGLLFLVAVNHFQAIHHISALDYALARILGITAVLTYFRAVDYRSTWRIILALVLLTLSAGAHISTAVLLPFCLFTSFQRGQTLPKRWLGFLAIITIALPVVVLAITAHTTTTWAALSERMNQGFLELILDMAGMYLWNVGRLFTTAHWHPLVTNTRRLLNNVHVARAAVLEVRGLDEAARLVPKSIQ